MEFKRKKLTLENKARIIFEELNKYYEKYPDRQTGPKVTITQDWEVLLNYEGEPCSSDFNDYVTLFINHYEDEDWWYTMDTIKSAIPFVDKELDENLPLCLKYLGEIPTHKNNIPSDIDYFMTMITSSIYQSWENTKNSDLFIGPYEVETMENEWLIEINMADSSVYPLNRKFRKPNYSESFCHLEIEDLLSSAPDGKQEINFKKVKEIAEKLVLNQLN
ncbi:MAG: hypothetical protein J1F16_11165 [Muribaculaceae bacterium]|nr:hypothetical protein [Muribaculaceae bacterium]